MTNRAIIRERRYDRVTPSATPGLEPPLSADGGQVPDRRRVSLRWLTGTILTGLFGTSLMGGAVYAALDGEYSFALAPTTAIGTGRDAASLDSRSNVDTKADRVVLQTVSDDPRQLVKVPETVRMSDGKDMIKVRPYMRINASLVLSPGEFASEVPRFNATTLARDAAELVGLPAAEQREPEAADTDDVTMTTRTMAEVPIGADTGMTLSLAQVRALARDLAFEAGANAIDVPTTIPKLVDTTASTPTTMSFADPNSSLRITIVEENVTDVAKTAATVSNREEHVTIAQGQTLGDILARIGATPAEITSITSALGDAADVHPGQHVNVTSEIVPGEGNRQRPVRVTIATTDDRSATVAMADSGDFTSLSDSDADNAEGSAGGQSGDDDADDGSGLRLYASIYETALQQKMPKQLVEQLMRVYAYDVDLNRRVRAGDSFEVFYEQDEAGNPTSDILFTALTVDGETKRYYRHADPDGGSIDYYDAMGKSARKFLMRAPLNGGRITSPFGYRHHPILGYAKLHSGVDWAAPAGTPIMATGNGTIVKAGWTNGYGKRIEIQHANGYMTTYNHMSALARGSVPGAKVGMGQIIGFVGSTGLSTGPHCHYEVKINGNFVDPMRIRLPQGKELGGAELVSFKQERDRIDDLLTRPGTAQTAQNGAGKNG